ncbi:HD domain-containing protein [Tetragenococcus halophilus]|uniref:HD domain-containing protein n=1 Tax=Tetragenococcus halophilus TaxID=51669 RepID=A0AB35HKX2_TETHA|nr:HD domain-containing protein [Tetragenococcus halophilus]MCF1601168.1 HD domain-containing protein [Tetragenococcus halophilus]MCF1675945.1 HD domain-containing protein [Tetragenococcus halophilus]MCO8285717.1 HD domain-containing protein [Tetragenococcus halophilus]MCO8290310.1 HD domain-containing protein [Tetragenococcus halophilus]MCO8293436.1 HD domain-containing protein [Tetragenococcus halophilus]
MEKLKDVISYAQENLAQESTGHDFEHAKRTAGLAEKIIKKDQLAVNNFIVMASAYLHDMIDDKVTDEPEKAQRTLVHFLQEINCSFAEIEAILEIIQNLSFSAEMFAKAKSLSLEGKIVQDADRLEALGAVGILRAAYFSGAHGQAIYDENKAVQHFHSKEDYRRPSTMINHMYEKLFLLPEMMNTYYGKKEGNRRKAFVEDFLEEFYKEC